MGASANIIDNLTAPLKIMQLTWRLELQYIPETLNMMHRVSKLAVWMHACAQCTKAVRAFSPQPPPQSSEHVPIPDSPEYSDFTSICTSRNDERPNGNLVAGGSQSLQTCWTLQLTPQCSPACCAAAGNRLWAAA